MQGIEDAITWYTLQNTVWNKGSSTFPNRMNFRKSSERGGGAIFNPKIYIAKFGPLKGLFQHENDIKGSF